MRTRFIQNDILAILQDYKMHNLREICNEVEISRSTCLRHLNDLSMHYNIQTFVGGRSTGGVKLIGKKQIDVNLTNDELQLVIKQLESLQGSKNIEAFANKLTRLIEKEQNDERRII